MFTAAQLEEEIHGSKQEIDKISESIDIYRYDKPANWMKPYTAQAVYRIQFKAPPRPLYDLSDQSLPEEDRQKQKDIDSAPKLLHVAMCLPAGYALLENPPSSSPSSSSSSSNPPSAFTFPNPVIIEESMHMLLIKVSPIYLAWFEIQMEDKLLALAARPDDDDD